MRSKIDYDFQNTSLRVTEENNDNIYNIVDIIFIVFDNVFGVVFTVLQCLAVL